MKKRKQTPIAKAKAEWRARERIYQQQAHETRLHIARLQYQLDMFKRAEERRKLEEKANWAAYDRAVDETTQAERDLFQASPAYQKYQQWRRDGHHAEENKRVDAIKYIHARGHLESGDWMAP